MTDFRREYKQIDADALRDILRGAIDAAGGQSAYAAIVGRNRRYINDLVHGRRPITDTVAGWLGYERVEGWRRKKTKVTKPKKPRVMAPGVIVFTMPQDVPTMARCVACDRETVVARMSQWSGYCSREDCVGERK